MLEDLILKLLVLMGLLFIIPTIVGSLTANIETVGQKGKMNLPLWWICGQILLWAGFQVICLPMVLTGESFGNVVTLFSCFMAVMVLLAVIVGIHRRKNPAFSLRIMESHAAQKDAVTVFLWCLVVILLVLQLAVAVLFAYEEGDDAFYVAISVITNKSDTMYVIYPYTGGSTGMDMRHGLAPFPIWVSYVARLAGMHPTTIAQIVLPVVLIVMSYSVYYLLANKFFGDRKKIAQFLLIVEIMVLFGGYSLQSVENFLLVRTAQGKAVLANIVIPVLFLLFLGILEELQHGRPVGVWRWLMVAATMTAGCLCSSEGSLLLCVFLGTVSLCMLACYRRWKLLLPMAGCCIAPMTVALLYFLL